MRRAFVAISLVPVCTLVAPVEGQCTGEHALGAWSPTYDWEETIKNRDANGDTLCTGPNGKNLEFEISHFSLIPAGPWRGGVLFWRREIDTSNCITGCAQATSVSWILHPSDPTAPVGVSATTTSDLFCGGHSWDRLGQLAVAGGIPAGCEALGVLFPGESYRFRPKLLSEQVATDQWGVRWASQSIAGAWTAVGSMAIGRYYPSLIPLNDSAPRLSSTHPTNPDALLPGGTNMVLGGPPYLEQGEGNEFWEILRAQTTGATPWEIPFVPENPSTPGAVAPGHFGTGQGQASPPDWDLYPQLPPGLNIPEYLLDSYPRAIQLQSGGVLICGDVDTGSSGAPVNSAGATWVLKPRYDSLQQENWELHDGPVGALSGATAWHDSFYDCAIPLQLWNATAGRWVERVLMFGGSREETGQGWVVNDEAWEFEPNPDPQSVNPLVTGTWVSKVDGTPPNVVPSTAAFPAFQRIFANAIVLPTGQVFVVGGSSTDDGSGHCADATVPVDDPVIYDLGAGQSDPGTVYVQPPNEIRSDPADPTETPIPGHTARLYHSVAVLLPDGRVLVGGGRERQFGPAEGSYPCLAASAHPDPRYSGEFFSPPYLTSGLSRPVISTAPSTIDFDDTFVLDVMRDASRVIDRVVLIRPGSVTHHFDNDQRYVELPFSTVQTETDGTVSVDELTVAAPLTDLCPPGYYMLFVVEAETVPCSLQGHRVPSVAKFVRLKT